VNGHMKKPQAISDQNQPKLEFEVNLKHDWK